MHKQRIAFLAGSPSKLQWQTDFSCHSNPPSRANVLRRQLGVRARYLLCLPIQDFYALSSNVFDACLFHHNLNMQKCTVRLHNSCAYAGFACLCFLSLCGCGGLRHATRQRLNAVAFWVCNVFLRLTGCGIWVFLHMRYMLRC